MLRFLTSFLCIAALLAPMTESASAQVAKEGKSIALRDGLKSMLQAQGAAKLSKVTVNVDADGAKMMKESFSIENGSGSYTVYKGLDADDNLIGSVVMVNEQGKEGPLQVLIAVDPEGSVYDIGFTIFGEDKGKPAQTWNFLKQYLGKSSSDPLTVGKDIDAVSGATWTSTSVTNAIKRGVVVYKSFVMES
ncbi:MAG: FMN-binding protein [Rhodothermales bacterium]|nr:FMN-binding protein [Rhodothermales bacterium]